MKSAGFQICTERASDGGPVCDVADGEAVALTVPVSFHIGDDVQGEAGILHITTRRLVWFGGGADSTGYEVPFTSLSMHAVSRGAEGGDADFSSPCIYAQVEGTPPEGFGATIAGGGGGDDRPEEAGDRDDEEDDEDEVDDDDDEFSAGGGDGDYDDMFELRIVPKDTAGLDEMFRVLCECAAMNPDDDDDDDDDGGFFYDEDEVMRGAGAEGRRAALDRFDEMLQIDPGVDDLIRDDPGRFEDDEDEEVK